MKSPIKINGKNLEIPISWDEITFGQFLNITKSTTDAEILAAITGIEKELCEQVNTELLSVLLSPLVELIKEEPPTVEPELICGQSFTKDIGKKEFARKVNCDAAFKKLQGMDLIGRITAVYLAQGIEDEDIEKFYNNMLHERFIYVLSSGRNLIEQLNKLNEIEKKIPSVRHRPEEVRAGIDRFKKYGVVGLVRGIALRWGISKDDVFKWSYNDVLTELFIGADESNYQRELQEILNPKK